MFARGVVACIVHSFYIFRISCASCQTLKNDCTAMYFRECERMTSRLGERESCFYRHQPPFTHRCGMFIVMFTSTFIIGFTFCLRREIGWSLRTRCSQMSEDKSCPISVVATATATFSGEDIIRPSYSAILCPDTHARHSEEETKLVSHPTWSSGVFSDLFLQT